MAARRDNFQTLPGFRYRLVVVAEERSGVREIICRVRAEYEGRGRRRRTARISTATRPRRRAPQPPSPPPPYSPATPTTPPPAIPSAPVEYSPVPMSDSPASPVEYSPRSPSPAPPPSPAQIPSLLVTGTSSPPRPAAPARPPPPTIRFAGRTPPPRPTHAPVATHPPRNHPMTVPGWADRAVPIWFKCPVCWQDRVGFKLSLSPALSKLLTDLTGTRTMSRRVGPDPTVNDYCYKCEEDWDQEIAPPASREALPPPPMSQDLPPPEENWDAEMEVVQRPPGRLFFKHGWLPVFVFDHEQPPEEQKKKRRKKKKNRQ
ncbi:uncharacterized protein LOC130055009 [Ostrea edulis]|uniref:uncharacterized protein LOC130055009 n=1 Tax=Ostrea edulis TaxID=37623 RepID=UPI0024AF03B3|nr:uncharacterized protein LOC130055009 [Ostrea edulis]